ncbi:MAG: PaaI family thioesterase [Candidatus Aminicenantes bacterium]|nr:PaaI family thioesterase [Candidatus Aminicenantes bacterium]
MKHKVKRKQPNSKMCLVCGLKNQLGLKTSYYEMDNNELVAVFNPLIEHQGYPGRLHGGIAAAVLDETIGRAIMIKYNKDIWGVTVDFNIRYKKPIPLNEELKVVGRVTQESSRLFEGTGELVLASGEIAAIGKGKYIKLPIEKIADFDIDHQEWKVIPSDQDPTELDI